jgi:hypothetical protein
MNTTARNAIVALALSVSGGLLAMNWTPPTSANKGNASQAFTQTDFAVIGPQGAVSQAFTQTDFALISAPELVNRVDSAKLK